MSAQLSPDGLWWWDGQQWVSALSPDGRWRWTGSRWELNARVDQPVQRRYQLAPTMETRPLQVAVIAYLVISTVIGVFVMSTTVGNTLHSLPAYQADTPQAQAAMDTIVNASIAGGIAATIVWNTLMAIGALLRWRWTYYLVMVLGFLSALAIIGNVIALAANSQSDRATASFISVLSNLAALALAVWMYRLWREGRTAWAMRHLPEPVPAPSN